MRSHAIRFVAIALIAAASNASADNLVINGGFETGSVIPWQDEDATFVTDAPGTVHSGTFALGFAERAAHRLRQLIATTPGATYVVDFYLARSQAIFGEDERFFVQASFAGTTFLSLDRSTLPLGSPYREYTFSIVATGVVSALDYMVADPPAVTYLDDVSVTLASAPPVPEPESYAMLLTGLGVLGMAASRRKALLGQRAERALVM